MGKQRINYDKDVICCKDCLSLKILGGKGIPEYCDECSSTNVEIIPIEEWERLYKEKYGRKFLEKEMTYDQIIGQKLKRKSDERREGRS